MVVALEKLDGLNVTRQNAEAVRLVENNPLAVEYCGRCAGAGVVVICPDEFCLGAGRCPHPGGEVNCWECDGSGQVKKSSDST